MKKILTILLLGLVATGAQADMKAIQNQLKLTSHLVSGGNAEQLLNQGNNNLSYHIDWPGSDGIRQAMLIIDWDGFSAEDLRDVKFTLDNRNPIRIEHKSQGTQQSWVFVPLGTRLVSMSHPKYGTTTVKLGNMNNHDVWSVPVVLDKLVNIEIKPLTDYDKPVRVTLVNPATGDETEAMSPATFERVLPGSYYVRFAIDGRNIERPITVTPTQKVFSGRDFDFRHSKAVTFESTEKAYFYIDGAYQAEGTTFTADIPYGTHTVQAKVNANQLDEKTIDVSDHSESIIYLSPIPSKTFEVVGMYQGKAVPTSIYVSGLSSDRYSTVENDKHLFTMPVGGIPYKYTLYYGGHSGSKTINVTRGMSNVQEIKISADRRMVWPWQRDYENVTNWFEFSYVAKQYATSGRLYENSSIKTTVKENGVWDSGYDRWLHGFRFGYHAQPAFKFGLGLYTGIFTEFYFSSTKSAPIGDYDNYFEWDLSVPLHILYQVPLGRKFCIGFHTGVSFNLAAVGSYYDSLSSDESDDVEDWDDFWSEPWAPSRFNMDWDFSLFVRWKKFMISGTLSRGLTDNKMHEDFGPKARTVMNKAIIAVSIGF